MRQLVLVTILFMLAGCQSPLPYSDSRPALVQKLATRGVSDANTWKIVLVGSEGGYGAETTVVITANFLVQEIWDTIYQSRPHKTYAASGNRKLRFYTDVDSDTPAAELLVNATDRCHFQEAFDEGSRCPGINRILEPLLKAEYAKRRGP